MTQVKDAMTDDVITVGKNDDLKHVMDLMQKHNITKVPVLDDGQLVGIVTDNMIAKKLGSFRKRGVKPSGIHASSVMDKDFEIAHPDAPLDELLPQVGAAGLTMIPVVSKGQLVGVHTKANLLHLVDSDTPIADIMTREVHTVTPDDRLVHARRLLIDNDIARLPVMDQGKLVGIVSEQQVAEAFAMLLEQVPFEHQQARARDLVVRDFMKAPVITCGVGQTAKQVAQKMIENQVGGMPVLDGDGHMHGFVTRTDLAQLINIRNGAA